MTTFDISEQREECFQHSASGSDEHPAVKRFREYLRIRTDHPSPDYAACTCFLKQWAADLGLQARSFELAAGKPIVLLTWEGTDPSLKSLLLNSHTDVVPVFPEHWSCPPFEAHKFRNGDIVARGSQDMKCVGAWYMEAIANMKAQGKQPLRTIHILFVPDEEIGGVDGMKAFTTRFLDQFRELNVGFALDEGIANPEDALKVFYGERLTWWVRVTANGTTGHGSQFIPGTATRKLTNVLQKFFKFRDEQEKLLHSSGAKLGDVTTVNLTMLNGGVQPNVVPQDASAVFDIRVTPRTNLNEFRKMIHDFCSSEEGVSYEFLQYSGNNQITQLDGNPWWAAFQEVCRDLGVKTSPEIFPAATDSRYIRALGIPALGVSYLKNMPVLLHCHNEYLNEHDYLEGVEFYTCLVDKLAGVREEF
ncbi:uncharacterized protein VTP21DRAFT_9274 [Calcarisporiella thermophila]|uniref:uncharacterized protein n=1 Tax=Calcarisporiella thermophila TaxID=911321 RepID=UPI003742B5D3